MHTPLIFTNLLLINYRQSGWILHFRCRVMKCKCMHLHLEFKCMQLGNQCYIQKAELHERDDVWHTFLHGSSRCFPVPTWTLATGVFPWLNYGWFWTASPARGQVNLLNGTAMSGSSFSLKRRRCPCMIFFWHAICSWFDKTLPFCPSHTVSLTPYALQDHIERFFPPKSFA